MKPGLSIVAVLTALGCLFGCRNPVSFPQQMFEEHILAKMPSSCRAFDARDISRRDGRTIWIAFDCSEADWKLLCNRLEIELRQVYSLRYISSPTPADTGFEGYIDDDYRQLTDKQGRIYYERKMRNGYRVVFFDRRT